jgi:hypothetical protein
MKKQGLPFYRCVLCSGVVSLWDIYVGPHACPKCGSVRVKPSNLSWVETIVQIWKHPKIWTWDESLFS